MIREATPEDSTELVRMRCALWPGSREEHASEVQTFFSGDSNQIDGVFVAENTPGRLIGFIELRLRDYAEGASISPVPYVEGWFIDEVFRSQGVGKALMQRAEEWARAGGFSELASDTEVENKTSFKAHTSLGFEETDRIVCFLKKL